MCVIQEYFSTKIHPEMEIHIKISVERWDQKSMLKLCTITNINFIIRNLTNILTNV